MGVSQFPGGSGEEGALSQALVYARVHLFTGSPALLNHCSAAEIKKPRRLRAWGFISNIAIAAMRLPAQDYNPVHPTNCGVLSMMPREIA
jgi:hypothetical protein